VIGSGRLSSASPSIAALSLGDTIRRAPRSPRGFRTSAAEPRFWYCTAQRCAVRKEIARFCRNDAHRSVLFEMRLKQTKTGHRKISVLRRQLNELLHTQSLRQIPLKDLRQIIIKTTVEGYSARSLKYMRALAAAWPEESIVQQLIVQLPWGHNLRVLDRIKDRPTREWYLRAALEYGWSQNIGVVAWIERRPRFPFSHLGYAAIFRGKPCSRDPPCRTPPCAPRQLSRRCLFVPPQLRNRRLNFAAMRPTPE
jgi:hypothetical protein